MSRNSVKSVRVPGTVPEKVDAALRLLAANGFSVLSDAQRAVVESHLAEHRGYNNGLIYTLALDLLLEQMQESLHATSR